jgi:hypothetical protein
VRGFFLNYHQHAIERSGFMGDVAQWEGKSCPLLGLVKIGNLKRKNSAISTGSPNDPRRMVPIPNK